MQIAKYATIVFDCDGVLIDANQPKVDAFVKAMPEGVSDEQRTLFAQTMARNFGKSRQWLLDTFAEICPAHASEDNIAGLLSRYSALVSSGYLQWAATEGSEAFIANAASTKTLYVASGSNQEELRQVFDKRGLRQYFADVLGGPVSKHENLRSIIDKAEQPALFVGDSIIDYESAQKCGGYDFAFYTPYSIDRENVIRFAQQNNIPMVHSFSEFQS
ncbi:MAG: HAD family hydrolase [Limnobacter sp.]|uniref:HAD family hydrolase n=1 Tax=Limnobacter sp. TaxID=2003368 RepID=UPI00391E0462